MRAIVDFPVLARPFSQKDAPHILSIFSISLVIYLLEKVDARLREAGRFVLAVVGVKGRITCEGEEAERVFSACYVLVCDKTLILYLQGTN